MSLLNFGKRVAAILSSGTRAVSSKPRVNRQTVLALFALSAVGFLLFRDLTKFEESGGYYSLNAVLAFAYLLLGKWGAIGVYGLCSAAVVFGTLFIGDRKRRGQLEQARREGIATAEPGRLGK